MLSGEKNLFHQYLLPMKEKSELLKGRYKKNAEKYKCVTVDNFLTN